MDKNIKYIFGLGNYINKYNLTRHNIGFYFINKIALNNNLTFKVFPYFKIKMCKLKIFKTYFFLLIPMCFMNVSGDLIKKFFKKLKLNFNYIFIIHDDFNLKLGTSKIKFNIKNNITHNGIKNISKNFSGKNFYRLRIGINRPKNNLNIHKYVLSKINFYEKKIIEKMIYLNILHLKNWLFHNNVTNIINLINKK